MRAWGVVVWLVALSLLAPAILLTVLRLVEPDAGRAVRLISFTPVAIPLYAAAIVVLLGASFVRAWGPRRAMLAPAVLAVLGLALQAWWFAPQELGANPPPAKGSPVLTIMNANLYEGRGDAVEVVRAASEGDVDVLVVEEVTDRALAAMEQAGLGELFPHRIGRPDGLVAGTMVFSHDSLDDPVQIATTHDSWRVGVDGLTLLAVHPVAPVTPDVWRADLDLVRASAEAADADLVVGDFNATPDHRPMRELLDAGYRDAAELANEGWQPTWPANGLGVLRGLPPLVRIDHVLVGSRLAAISTRTVAIDGTDHKALVARVALK